MKRGIWAIDGINEVFKTLSDAKWHVEIAFTPRERVKYLRYTSISHVVDGKCVSTVAIRIDNDGNFKFGRIKKF